MNASLPVRASATTTDAMLLAFIAGFVDSVGFVALFGLFTAHVTGNFILLGAALIRPSHGVIAKLLALPVFLLAVMATTAYVGRHRPQWGTPLTVVVLAQMLLLTGFGVLGQLALPISNADQPLAIAAGLIGVAAMGVQNAASRLLLPELPPTTVMTGNVTQLAADATQLWFGPRGGDSAAMRTRLAKFWPPLLAFAIGAAAGAVAYQLLAFFSLGIAVLALAIVLLRCRGRGVAA
ncbi:uncharacterized membrane protein YoaK (UPF0700 family) [Tahibacter aquaticus]|uniref:Uncharacterized membrane protein YoaK (UPF0700 family) n=1 Tax=Tahibacter aquaticus TaxID=520092 RepID=A0A4R6Z0Q9_9GAMM|nr:YoaK family protein [Tahibacter aquaticus]TDR45004.1 uncharacterized membrane protein YoaK (UPF0700 family) [Tahibacter aquaticus]